MRSIAVLCLTCLLGGCFTPAGNLTVQPLDEPEFRTMAAALRPQLTGHGLLTDDGAWYSARPNMPEPSCSTACLRPSAFPAWIRLCCPSRSGAC